MKILHKPCGEYQTNCYILNVDEKEFIIDPGIGADKWVQSVVNNPIAILNTHGHFDHIWSNSALKEHYGIPIYVPKEDAFMLQNDPFGHGTPPSTADIEVEPDATVVIEGTSVTFSHFPGHTPGCSIIEIGDVIFSGDFIFQGSIGRYDFPFSDADAMRKSIKRFLERKENKTIYPGHGPSTTINKERRVLEYFYQIV
jgi:glyoxylase-like metal-dependent hydrolase (beta-lactamase superfamily II)